MVPELPVETAGPVSGPPQPLGQGLHQGQDLASGFWPGMRLPGATGPAFPLHDQHLRDVEPSPPTPLPRAPCRPSPSRPTQCLCIGSEQRPLLLIFSKDGHIPRNVCSRLGTWRLIVQGVWGRVGGAGCCETFSGWITPSQRSPGRWTSRNPSAYRWSWPAHCPECGNPGAHKPEPRPLRREPPHGVPRHHVES